MYVIFSSGKIAQKTRGYFMLNYGKRLKQARLSKGLTQIEMAEQMHISQTSYQRIESGAHDIKMSTIYSICKILGISADYLLGLEFNFEDF